MKKIIVVFLGLFSFFANSQDNKTWIDSLDQFTTQYNKKYFTIGTLYNANISLIGFQVGNGNTEQPIIHFEDLTSTILFKISAQTDFKNEYSLSNTVSWNYPFNGMLPLVSLNYDQSKISENNLFLRNIGLSTKYYLQCTTGLDVLGKISHQRLDKNSNIGIGLGLQNTHNNFYYGLRADYFMYYWNYTAFLHTLVIKEEISFGIVYDRVEKFDFINIGVSYVISKS